MGGENKRASNTGRQGSLQAWHLCFRNLALALGKENIWWGNIFMGKDKSWIGKIIEWHRIQDKEISHDKKYFANKPIYDLFQPSAPTCSTPTGGSGHCRDIQVGYWYQLGTRYSLHTCRAANILTHVSGLSPALSWSGPVAWLHLLQVSFRSWSLLPRWSLRRAPTPAGAATGTATGSHYIRVNNKHTNTKSRESKHQSNPFLLLHLQTCRPSKTCHPPTLVQTLFLLRRSSTTLSPAQLQVTCVSKRTYILPSYILCTLQQFQDVVK